MAGFAAGGAAYSALNCPSGVAIATCALQGGVSGAATGVGFAVGCPFCGGMAGSLTTQAMAGNGISVTDAIGAGLLAEGGARLTSRNRAGTSVNNVRTSVTNIRTNGVLGSTGARACSFVGGTPVLMADGSTKPLSKVRAGDEVMAADPETGEREPRKVSHLWVHQDTVQDLKVGSGVVTTTEDHPFWNVTDQEWQEAQDLDRGDLLVTADGKVVDVRGLIAGTERIDTAYNLTVEGIHTYHVFVGSQPVLVHNQCAANASGGGGGRRLRPDQNATGEHSTFRRDGTTGEVTHTATWKPQSNPQNPAPWEMVQRVDKVGQPHFNKVTGEYVPTPHVQGPNVPGGARPAEPWEIPGAP